MGWALTSSPRIEPPADDTKSGVALDLGQVSPPAPAMKERDPAERRGLIENSYSVTVECFCLGAHDDSEADAGGAALDWGAHERPPDVRRAQLIHIRHEGVSPTLASLGPTR